MDEDKRKKRDAAIAAATKKYGEGAAMLGAQGKLDVEVVPTGSVELDKALGVGGYPRGRVIEIYGKEASGKSTTTLHAIAEVQKLGGTAALIDAEHATDPVYATAIGVNMDELVICQPDYGEQALDMADDFVSSGAFDIVVVDSVAALVPKAEIEGSNEQNSMGLQARMMSQALRKLTAKVSKSKTILFFVNQTREKIGVMFGNPETTSGGNALKFYASVRLRISKHLNDEQKARGEVHTAKIQVIKNKVSPPFKYAEFEVVHGIGIDRAAEIISAAVKLSIIDKGGAWYTWEGKKYQGMLALRDKVLEGGPEVIDDLENKVRKAYGIPAI